jgi:hypothetical protein
VFIGTQPYNGLIVTNILLNSWDWKTSNNKIYRFKSGVSPPQRYVVRDLGASLGKTTPAVPLGPAASHSRLQPGDAEQRRRFRIAGLHQAGRRARRRLRFPNDLRQRRRSGEAGRCTLDGQSVQPHHRRTVG